MKVQLDSALERVLQKINLKYHKKLLYLDGKANEAEFVIESFCALKEHHRLNPGRTSQQISDPQLFRQIWERESRGHDGGFCPEAKS